MRRKEGSLVPLEVSILEVFLTFRSRGIAEAHGFLIAKELRGARHARRLTAYGTLYKALDRLERSGLLVSRWEDPMTAAGERRPRRRFYRLTLTGEAALQEVAADKRNRPTPRPAAIEPA